MQACNKLECGGSLRTKTASGDRRIWVAFDIDDLFIFNVDELPTANCTVGADGRNDAINVASPGCELASASRGRFFAQSVKVATLNLLKNWPIS